MELSKMTNFELFDIVLNGDPIELEEITKEPVTLQGWVRTNRSNGQIGFIEFNDGTYFKNVQLVYSKDNKAYDLLASFRNGCAIEINIPPMWCCTDNAAMIAKVAERLYELKVFAPLNLSVDPNWEIDEWNKF